MTGPMKKTMVVFGYGPGVSSAVAERFGREGFSVALVARTSERTAAGVEALAAQKIEAAAFRADASNPKAVEAVIARVRDTIGPIAALHWNAYGTGAGDLLEASASDLRAVFDVSVTSLVCAVRAALTDLKQAKGAVLVTNGGFGFDDPAVDALAVRFGSMGLALGNAAKQKVVTLLAERLRGDGVYVGQAIVTGTIKGTAWDHGNADVEPSAVAAKLWELSTRRAEVTATVHGG